MRSNGEEEEEECVGGLCGDPCVCENTVQRVAVNHGRKGWIDGRHRSMHYDWAGWL